MPSRGQDGRADVEYFEKHIRPLFSQHCAECHDGKKQKGGLRLDAPRFIRKGGDTGPIFVAGEPDKSDIIEAVRHTNPDFKMPPKKKLSGIEIAHMEKWVRSGAPMPEDDANVVEGPFDYENWRQFWSFKPLKKPDAPQVKNAKWVRNPIDAFIAAGQEAAGLAPAREADRHTLIRRATYDLLGLPPTPAEIDAFVNDTSPDAYEKLIRRLLASPYYGEKYGRHWLDVARYEQGRVKVPGVKNTRGELDYRDYVVRAFNQDKRYDRFIMEQLAGDLLPPAKEKQDYFDQLIATAYLSIGNWFDECTDPNRLRLDMIDEQLNATGKAFLGLTLSCARCHDHKHDPITTEDYYALAGIFRSTRIVDEFSEEWRDGRVRLTRELMTREQEDLAAANAAEIAARRAEMTLRLALATANLHALWKQDHAAYVQAAKQVPALGATAFEAEAFAGQSDLKVTLLEQDGQRIEVLEAQKPIDQWVKYELNVPEQGRYVLEARYASGEPRPLDVQVGGTTVLKGVLAEDTFGVKPEHWRWQVIGELDLRQGVNTIRLSTPQKGDLFPSIDRFRWYPVNADRRQAIDRIAKERSLDAARLARYADYPEEPFPSGVAIIPFVDEETRQQIAQAFAELGKLKAARPKAPLIITATDYRETFDLPVHVSGDPYRTRGAPVPRRTPTPPEHALTPPALPADTSARLGPPTTRTRGPRR